MRRLALLLPLLLLPFLLLAAAVSADEPVVPEAAFMAGDKFHYERVITDLTKATKRTGTVIWEALESTSTGHRLRVSETMEGKTTATVWRFNRDNNTLAQELDGKCEQLMEPHAGRYQWPMSSSTTWNRTYRVYERCSGSDETKLLAQCELMAKVVGQGSIEVIDKPWPAIAIERIVLCKMPANPGYVAARWEKELLCPTLGVRCMFEADTVMLAPEQATDKTLAAYRSNAQGQYYSGRTTDNLKDLELPR